jgi:acyl-CoA synthetase (AMP-forming)/AMP-acid ligase II
VKSLECRTLTEALMAAPPDRPFITMHRGDDDITTVTFGEFIQQARRQAASLVAEGVQPGDRVVLIMPQGIQVMATFAAAMLVGAIPTILAYPNFKIEPS